MIAAEVITLTRAVSRAGKLYTEHPALLNFDDVHIHEFYELFCLLSGDVDYHVEGTVYPLAPGDILLMKKVEAHTARIRSDCPYERISVHFNENMLVGTGRKELVQFLDERPLGQRNLFSAADHPDTHWQYYMEQIHATTSRAKRELFISLLIREMCEIRRNVAAVVPAKGIGVIPEMVNYISGNLTKPLRIEELCSRFYISRAQLNRKFKAFTGKSVWEYITDKRLLLARDLLQTKDSPATACAKAGFNDYSAFYRAYKAKFGVSPKADQRQE